MSDCPRLSEEEKKSNKNSRSNHNFCLLLRKTFDRLSTPSLSSEAYSSNKRCRSLCHTPTRPCLFYLAHSCHVIIIIISFSFVLLKLRVISVIQNITTPTKKNIHLCYFNALIFWNFNFINTINK